MKSSQHWNKKRLTTPCKNNCLGLAYLEIPAEFPMVRFIFSKLVAKPRNYPYTTTLPLIMKKIKLIISIFILIINQSCKKKNVELSIFDCMPENQSIINLKNIDFKILSKHKVLTDTTKSYLRKIKLISFENKLHINYTNIYNQTLDTIFHINDNKEQIFLCLDKFKGYKTETFIEKAIDSDKIWNLRITPNEDCFGLGSFEIEFFKENGKLIVKSSYWAILDSSGKKKKIIKSKEIKQENLDKLVLLEKQIRLIKRVNNEQQPTTKYDITYGESKFTINKSIDSRFDEYFILKDLGIN